MTTDDRWGRNRTAVRAPRIAWCFWCRRAVRQDDAEAHRVTVPVDAKARLAVAAAVTYSLADSMTREEWVCGRCWEKSDPPVPVDYTEEDREGQPEFNGAFR